MLLTITEKNCNLEDLIYEFVKNNNHKYVSIQDIYRFFEINKLLVKIEKQLGSNNYNEISKITDRLVNNGKIKKEICQMVTHFYV